MSRDLYQNFNSDIFSSSGLHLIRRGEEGGGGEGPHREFRLPEELHAAFEEPFHRLSKLISSTHL